MVVVVVVSPSMCYVGMSLHVVVCVVWCFISSGVVWQFLQVVLCSTLLQVVVCGDFSSSGGVCCVACYFKWCCVVISSSGVVWRFLQVVLCVVWHVTSSGVVW